MQRLIFQSLLGLSYDLLIRLVRFAIVNDISIFFSLEIHALLYIVMCFVVVISDYQLNYQLNSMRV